MVIFLILSLFMKGSLKIRGKSKFLREFFISGHLGGEKLGIIYTEAIMWVEEDPQNARRL